ncbi:transposase [Patescibacteria group bacterium]
MPLRAVPLVNNEVYHIYNRSITSTPTFTCKRDYQRALNILNYYQYANTPDSYSKLKRYSLKEKSDLFNRLKKENKVLIKIISFCLMPNHFHFLLQQQKEEGISKCVGNFQNSYTRFFNLKNKRLGPLFQGAFKAVRIETDEQFLHVSRYIHLNPYSSLIVKSFKDVAKYPWSSLKEYLNPNKETISSPKSVISHFESSQAYLKFVLDQAKYQKSLEEIKHLILEKVNRT